ncbi:MAG: hypothetical protein E4H14_12700 [Candidatus Thorarchaeota archaeon]|nr:MAG: hypothetical protein E4H14_12700 [Candidatus Thorarchaeota archaeon]
MHGQMKGKFVRTMYWVGIILDAIVGIDILQATVTGQSFGIFLPPLTEGIRYLEIQVAIFMFGWTALLYWGSREPINRRIILLMTAFPVVVGLMSSNIYVLLIGLSSAITVTMNIVIQSILFVSLLLSFYLAETYARSKQKK